MNQVLKDWERAAEGYKVAKNIAEKLAASLRPAGYYAIPPLLESRRLAYGVPNGAFEIFPAFDKVLLYQVPMPGQGSETYEGSRLVKPEMVQAFERNTAPRGILVSAGLQAMDTLASSGIQVGHLVRFRKLSPFVLPVETIDGKQLYVMLVRDGDVVASEDLATELNERRAEIKNISKDGYDHRIAGALGDISGGKLNADYDPSV